MIRRALVLSALLLSALASTSGARVLVVRYDGPYPDEETRVTYERSMDMKFGYFQSVLRRLGVDYDVVSGCAVKTEYARRGVFPSGGSTVSYSGIIHWNVSGITHRQAVCHAYMAPESLTLSAVGSDGTQGPRVPQLMLYTNVMAANVNMAWINGATSSASYVPCSTGVKGPTDVSSPETAMVPFYLQAAQTVQGIYQRGESERVLAASYLGYCVLKETAPPGGVRPILSSRGRAAINRNIGYGTPVANPDSFPVQANPDTVVVWERMMTHLPGAKSIVFGYYMGGSDLQDSTTLSVGNIPCEGEPVVLLASLARFDSLCGGTVITKPLRLGLTIDGAFSRGGRRHPWALYADDSSTVKAVIDSLRSRHIPAVLGVNVDSVASYPSEKSWWSRWSELRYTPSPRYGLDTLKVAASGGNTTAHPVDPWGRYRVRIARGDDTFTGRDSSLFSSLKWYRDTTRTLFGSLSRTAIAPRDDWSPLRYTRPDSVLGVLWALGYSTLLVDNQKPVRYWPSSNPAGYGADVFPQGRYGNVNLIGHGGYNLSGGALQWDVRSDSVPPLQSNYISSNSSPISYEQSRWWAGLLYEHFIDYDYIPYDQLATSGSGVVGSDNLWNDVNRPIADRFYWFRPAKVIRIGVNDLGGNPSGPPARWAWWAIKSMDESFRIINRLANKSVCGWAYPEEIDPR